MFSIFQDSKFYRSKFHCSSNLSTRFCTSKNEISSIVNRIWASDVRSILYGHWVEIRWRLLSWFMLEVVWKWSTAVGKWLCWYVYFFFQSQSILFSVTLRVWYLNFDHTEIVWYQISPPKSIVNARPRQFISFYIQF